MLRRLLPLLLPLIVCCQASRPPSKNLHGAYQFPDGRLVAVTAGPEGTLRARTLQSGESVTLIPDEERWRVRTDFLRVERPEVRVEIDGTSYRWAEGGRDQSATRLMLREEDVSFSSSDGTRLHGRLVLPQGGSTFPAAVLVHGSGRDAASLSYPEKWFFAANGIAVLAFDKRGTGSSGGRFTADFQPLAADVAAAVRWLRKRKDIAGDKVGLVGFSQGGWVAPLAATMEPVAWVIINYGMIDSPRYEENVQTLMRLRESGFSEQELAEAKQLVEASTEVVASGFTKWAEFDAVRKKFRGRPWMKRLDGTTPEALMKYPHWITRIVGPRYAQPQLDWNYDGRASLGRLSIPVVWILGGRDISAPNVGTVAEIRRLQQSGKRHELVLFEDADHGIVRFELRDGKRRYLGFEPRYSSTLVSTARRLAGLEP